MRPPGYHHSGFVATHALGHMMYGKALLAPMNQRVLNKLSKEDNINGHKVSMTHSVPKSHRSKMGIYIKFGTALYQAFHICPKLCKLSRGFQE